MRELRTFIYILLLLLIYSCGDNQESNNTGSPLLVMEIPHLKAQSKPCSVPFQATLTISGVSGSISLTPDTDCIASTPLPQIPLGERRFTVTYTDLVYGVVLATAEATVLIHEGSNTISANMFTLNREFDDDGDGYSNLVEVIFGTDPKNRAQTPFGLKATAISAGFQHTCALLSDKTIQCWGSNVFGQLGNGSRTDSTAPVKVDGINTATAVSSGFFHTCALLSNGTIRCWGNNSDGQLGNGMTTDSTTPVKVDGINTAIAVSGGKCALLSDKTIRCWGPNGFGELGNTTFVPSSIPVGVISTNAATSISSGETHNCALLSDGAIQCWGNNISGQLGNGTTNISSTPVGVTGLTTAAAAISAGGFHTCGLLFDRIIQCWGSNQSGQLGNGTKTNSSVPVNVSGINSATAVSGGQKHSCALLSVGTVRCWGLNLQGQLGNGITTDSTMSVEVAGIRTAIAISAGGGHTCALLSEGSIRCWGDNDIGQLGDGTTTDSATPVEAKIAPPNLGGSLFRYRLEYVSGDNQTWGGGGIPAAMVFKIFDNTTKTYVENGFDGLVMRTDGNIGREDGGWCWGCFSPGEEADLTTVETYWYVEPCSPNPPYDLFILISAIDGNTGRHIENSPYLMRHKISRSDSFCDR